MRACATRLVVALIAAAALTRGADATPMARSAADQSTTGGRGTPQAKPTATPPPSTAGPRSVPPPIVLPLPNLPTLPTGGLITPQNFPTFPTGGLINPSPPFRTRPKFFPSGGSGWAYPIASYPPEQTTSRQGEPTKGGLRLSVLPASAQVFVDSFYVGRVEDVNAQNVFLLESGPHRVEIRAPGYETLTFDVRIDPHETTIYRGALEPLRHETPPASAAVRPRTPQTIYVIPHCYMGNVPPRQELLPAGCDVNAVRVVER